jgi:hypothetical protein
MLTIKIGLIANRAAPLSIQWLRVRVPSASLDAFHSAHAYRDLQHLLAKILEITQEKRKMSDEPIPVTTEKLRDVATELAKRLCDDPIVSDDIKELATVVRMLAEWQVDGEAAIQKLAARPAGRSVIINNGR